MCWLCMTNFVWDDCQVLTSIENIFLDLVSFFNSLFKVVKFNPSAVLSSSSFTGSRGFFLQIEILMSFAENYLFLDFELISLNDRHVCHVCRRFTLYRHGLF